MSVGLAQGGRYAMLLLALALIAGAPGVGACRRVHSALAQGEQEAGATWTGTGTTADPVQLDGRERVEWHQAGKTVEEVRAFRYMAVIGQLPRDVQDVRCEAKAPEGPFICSGKLPPMPPGIHAVRLIAVAKDGPKNLVSQWSAPIVVEKR